MPGALGSVARVAAAMVASAQGAYHSKGLAGAPSEPGLGQHAAAEKFIAGVPVLNYHNAYTGQTYSDGSATVLSAGEFADASAHEEAWIVVLKKGASDRQIRGMCEQTPYGCTNWGHEGGFPFIALSGTEHHLAQVVGPALDTAEYIELDFTVSLDPEEDDQGQDENEEDEEPLASWGLDRVGLRNAWATAMGAGVHVYVLDTGIRTEHVDFGGRAFGFADAYLPATGWPHQTVLCSTLPADSGCGEDARGHGTHCAGTVAGTTFGVAPLASVHAVKVLNNTGSGSTSGILAGLDLILNNMQMPAVVSMSLGGVGQATTYAGAIDALVAANIPVVVSAGNDFKDACIKTPASVQSAITVGSTDSEDKRSSFSNFGVCVDIWAPGSAILSAQGDASFPDLNASTSKSGTSMATPHVSGGAALLLSMNPSLTVGEVLAAMRANASRNYITDLSPTDEHNELLYVGDPSQPALPEQPQGAWPDDEFFASCENKGQRGPLAPEMICSCSQRSEGAQCYEGYTLGCTIGILLEKLQEERGNSTNFSLNYFEWNCTDCNCYLEPPVPPVSPAPPWTVVWVVVGILVVLGALFLLFMGQDTQSEERSSQSDTSGINLADQSTA